MAIYTPFAPEDSSRVAEAFSLGKLVSSTGVPQGSINTNYSLVTSSGRFFLRHTTVRSAADLSFEAALIEHLVEAGFPAPKLVRTREGAPFLEARGGRVSVFHYLPGEERSRAELTPELVERVGAELGKMHRLTGSFSGERENPYSVGVVRAWVGELETHHDRELSAFAHSFLRYLEPQPDAALLPRGAIHADLFLDNVKWVGDRVSAFFDFEMACRDAYVLDLAITFNAWCFDGGYDFALGRALVRGYRAERPLSEAEIAALHGRALFGAIRYTASRIRDFHLSQLPPERLQRKDFRTYLARAKALAEISPEALAEKLGLRSPR